VTAAREWLELKLRGAILRAREDDRRLFERGVGERSIMFRVGHYLAPAVEEPSPPRMWLDLEFNRKVDVTGDRTPKRMVVMLQQKLDDFKDLGRTRLVVPDLIIHDRTDELRDDHSGPSDHNIIVVEAKKSPADPRGEKYDRDKLDAYQRTFGYQYGVFLTLGEEEPHWQWIAFSDAASFACTSDRDTSPVYSSTHETLGVAVRPW
jgi:hypothetical protein